MERTGPSSPPKPSPKMQALQAKVAKTLFPNSPEAKTTPMNPPITPEMARRIENLQKVFVPISPASL